MVSIIKSHFFCRLNDLTKFLFLFLTLFYTMRLQFFTQNRFLRHFLFWFFYLLATSFAIYSKMEETYFGEVLGYQLSEQFFGMIMAYWFPIIY